MCAFICTMIKARLPVFISRSKSVYATKPLLPEMELLIDSNTKLFG